ncbi:hypothetical protein FGADI_4552 [Fusarium gaditjirri]|uniref:Uncharacterized protein n=1 Tax=Fusarium gaditjirri TaxID=282569 RepID=A0A8H4WYS9_9HYPO|nr:hypothetical protein FGADI_4552 [Fusarium gaditjirri]
MLDRLYFRLEHRAFELLVIWDIPLTKLRKWTSRTFDEFLSSLPEVPFKPTAEEQASLTFYVPFLIQLLRPQYSLQVIQNALKTWTLTQQDLDRFQKNYRTRQCPPSLLGTLGDSRTPHYKLDAISRPSQQLLALNDDDSELDRALHLDKMFPAVVGIHIDGYTTFDLSPELQRKASLASRRQEVCNRIERHNTCIYQYEWSDEFHLPVANQVIDDLEDNILSSTRDNILSSTGDNILSSTGDNILSSTGDNILSSTRDNILSSTGDNILSSTGDNILSSAEDNILSSLEDNILSSLEDNILSPQKANAGALIGC